MSKVTSYLCRGGATHGIMVAGRKVLADLALSKDDARALAQDKAGGGHARDRRNLYLVSMEASESEL